jgi:general stress protein 26
MLTLLNTNGQVTDTKATILTANSNKKILHTVALHNTHNATVELQIWFNDGANSRKMFHIDLEQDATFILDNKINFDDGDYLEAQASVTAVINYWVSYVEDIP